MTAIVPSTPAAVYAAYAAKVPTWQPKHGHGCGSCQVAWIDSDPCWLCGQPGKPIGMWVTPVEGKPRLLRCPPEKWDGVTWWSAPDAGPTGSSAAGSSA